MSRKTIGRQISEFLSKSLTSITWREIYSFICLPGCTSVCMHRRIMKADLLFAGLISFVRVFACLQGKQKESGAGTEISGTIMVLEVTK